MITYPADKIYEEAAFIAYYMHWGHDEIMAMSHMDRLRWCREISKLAATDNQPKHLSAYNMFVMNELWWKLTADGSREGLAGCSLK